MIRKHLITVMIMMILVGHLASQESWTLKRCIEHAIANSIDIEQSELRIKDATILTKLSKQQQYPSLSFTSNAFLNLGRSIDPTTNQFVTQSFFSNGYTFNANVLLFNAGRLKNDIRQNENEQSAVAYDKSAMIDQITVNVVSAFFNVLFGEDNLENNRVQLKTIGDQIAQMQKLIDAGSRPAFELLDLDAQKASIEQQLAVTQNQVDLAFINLKALLNLPMDYEMTLSSPPVEQTSYTNLDIVTMEEIYSRVLGRQPAAKAIESRLQSAVVGVDIAKSQFYPTVSAGANAGTNFSNQFREIQSVNFEEINSDVRINGNPAVITANQAVPVFANKPYFGQIENNFNYGFGMSMSVPIYNRYSAKAGLERAKINVENFTAEREKNNLNVRNTVGQLYTDARAARKNLDAAQRTLKAREMAFENAEKRYNLGAINSYDYINTQDQLLQAKTQETIARFEYALRIKLLDFYQGYPVTLE